MKTNLKTLIVWAACPGMQYYVPVKSKLKHLPPPPPPPGIPWAFEVFSCRGEREFDELNLPGAGI